MKFDYDLVIIGSTEEAIYAALMAVHLKARVALVEQPSEGQIAVSETIFRRRFSHVNRLYQQLKLINSQTREFPLESLIDWSEEVKQIAKEQQSAAILSAYGVDVIPDSGEMVRLPQLAFVVGSRKLRSRNYLLATGSIYAPISKPELEAVSYLQYNHLWHPDKLRHLPENLAIISETVLGIELAQNLNYIGKKVTLITDNKSILPREDPEIVRYLQSQLEAEGINILTNSSLKQIKYIEGEKWLQVGDKAISFAEIILVNKSQANIEKLNLQGVGVELIDKKIKVNQKMQTSNPRIYACGSVLGGDSEISIAQYEAQIAVKNSLFIPFFKVKYNHLPSVIFTNPPLAKVGMTENQAKAYYREKVTIIQQPLTTIMQTQILGESTGLCKIILHENGDILGAYIFGAEAGELINILALAIQQGIKINKLADLFPPYSSLSKIISNTALKWRQQKWKQAKILTHWLENWLIWRRN